MTKAPRPGHVKTRLVPPLTPTQAAELNRCFLRDTAAAIAQACGDSATGVAVYTPKGAEADYADLLLREFYLLPHRTGSFGERLIGAGEDLFQIGFASVCLIDSDSPTVPPECYSRAATLLQSKQDVVVPGPSEDGGYYLIGLNKLHRRLFEDIDWSTERVTEQTIARAKELNLPVEMLQTGYDIDDPVTLRRACDELLASDTRSAMNVAPHTREFLSRLVGQREL
ncbi:MAG: TIGR04282 family arsenosugar biosynthesis glycosyltransferase [Chthoniobacterales bacterium]